MGICEHVRVLKGGEMKAKCPSRHSGRIAFYSFAHLCTYRHIGALKFGGQKVPGSRVDAPLVEHS